MASIQRPNKISDQPRIVLSRVLSAFTQAGYGVADVDRNAASDSTGWTVELKAEQDLGGGASVTVLVSDACYLQRTDVSDQAQYPFSDYMGFVQSITGTAFRFRAI